MLHVLSLLVAQFQSAQIRRWTIVGLNIGCLSIFFFAVVIEDDRIDEVLKGMNDKSSPGV